MECMLRVAVAGLFGQIGTRAGGQGPASAAPRHSRYVARGRAPNRESVPGVAGPTLVLLAPVA
eukprot:2064742-Lingulodinium_polyedra.AAC.1